MIDLRCGDCLDILPTLESESVDLIFADPPFNVGKKYGGNGNADRRADYYAWCEQWINECFRVLKPTGTLYLMTIPKHLGTTYPLLERHGTFITQVIWEHSTGANDDRRFWGKYQPILVYGKSDAYYFNPKGQTVKKNWGRWDRSGVTDGHQGRVMDVWNDITPIYSGSITHPEAILQDGTNRKLHPAQMPIALIERAILFSTDIGDTVLEPFMGLAAGGVACVRHDRGYIGFEQVQEYYCESQKRIAEAQLQIPMELE